MSTIVYGPQLKDLILEELSEFEYKTSSDLMEALPGRCVTHIETALRTLLSSKSVTFQMEAGRKAWRRT